ncbi:Uncharacterised protein [Mycolicibacterium aurum]|uniref:DUF4174 domain-containing protein n=2 Tax=Mycolicibacterium aurum TaxID=1791 RepID=A0A448J1U2_MYCAU|nr:Uncharacterised protein [Mycolicibacterium aurum]
MTRIRRSRLITLSALTLSVLMASIALGSGSAAAAGLGDYRWTHRPLLLFAATDSEPQLVETLGRIDASRCEFVGRDMVLGVVVTEGTSTLDGRILNADEAQRLWDQYGIDGNAFTALLIGKDGGEKRRVTGVPDLSAIYALIDGMPMRSREITADPSQC